MNSNRNRYSSAPTYGMQKRTTGKRPTFNKPKAASPQGAIPPQGMPYSQGPAPMPGGMPSQPPIPQGAMMMPPGSYPPVQGYGYAPQNPAYPTPSAGGVQTGPQMGGYPPVTGAMGPQQPLPYPPASPYAQAPVPQAQAAPKVKGRRKDTWLQLLLLAILPILFIIAMVMKETPLFWVFIGFALVGLCAMWLQSTFVSSARATLSLIYGALLIVSAVSVISGATPRDTTTSANGSGVQAAAQPSGSGAAAQPTSDPALAGFVDINASDNPYLAEITPEPAVGTSEAALQLDSFMNLWYANKLDDMVSLCAPSWSAGLDDARKSLYAILANRLPVEFDLEKITGTDADSSRTITMTVLVDRQNNREPSKYRFQVLMLKENGAWYVDPQSLASNEAITTAAPEGSDTAPSTPEPTAAPSAKTKLYYNPDGGSYYHRVDNCSSVNSKYLPLSAFYYGDLEKTKFKNLKPCSKCNAPARP